MTATTSTVTLRTVTEEDHDFLVGVFASTREDELAIIEWPDAAREAFVRIQFETQDTSYWAQNPHGTFDLVEVDGVAAGRLYVDRRPTEIRLIDVTLLPEFRGRGIGRNLITRLTDEAVASDRTVSLHVEIHNRAAALYARLGFVVVAEHGFRQRMEWAPPVGEARPLPQAKDAS